MKAQQRFRIAAILVVFVTIIAFPLINDNFHLVKDIRSSENRKMAVKPEMKITSLDSFPLKYEQYYNDAFPLRATLVRNYNSFKLGVFKQSPLPEQVIIGDQGWLYNAGDEDMIFKNTCPLSELQLAAFKLELEYRTDYLRKKGIQYYLLIAPVKAAVYPEYTPNNNFRPSQKTWGEQLMQYLQKNSKVNTIDVFKPLRAGKGKGLMYYRLDNHWTQLGAFYAANEALRVIHKGESSVSPLAIDSFKVSVTKRKGGNLVKLLAEVDLYTDEFSQVEPLSGFHSEEVAEVGYPIPKGFSYTKDYEVDREIKGSANPSLLLISDSFGGPIFPFLSERFSRSVKIFDAWKYMLNEDIIEQEKPDVVILMVHEARLLRMLDHQSRLQAIPKN